MMRHWPAHHAVNRLAYSSRAYSSRAKLPGWAEQLTRVISDDRLAEYDKSIRIDRSGELPLQDTSRMPQIKKTWADRRRKKSNAFRPSSGIAECAVPRIKAADCRLFRPMRRRNRSAGGPARPISALRNPR